MVLLLLLVSPVWAIPVEVYYTDFDSGLPSEFSGAGTITGVQGYDSFPGSNFSGYFLRNNSQGNPAASTILTLTGLPPHTSVDISFLLAIIDSWDGSQPCCAPDYFNVEIDSLNIFSETFSNGKAQSYPGTPLTSGTHLGFNSSYTDSAYEMFFTNIPHTSSTLRISWYASGGGWQGGGDESWAIENLRVVVDTTTAPIPEPSTILLFSSGLVGLAGLKKIFI
jgi:hypothetical protein